MRLILAFTKEQNMRFVSHLDMQRLFQRAMRRAHLPLAYSQGFNPHPLLSFAAALALGTASDCEYLDVMLTEAVEPDEAMQALNKTLPQGVHVIKAVDAGDAKLSLTSLMRSAAYEVTICFDAEIGADKLCNTMDELLTGEIVVLKNTKSGIKNVDIRPMVISAHIEATGKNTAKLSLKGALTASGGLNVELFLCAYFEKLGMNGVCEVRRRSIEMDQTVIKL